jgi:hypothetical protein
MEKKKAAPVKKEDLNPDPLPLTLPLPATTTEQQDITTEGQRKVNLIWEYTQAGIAIVVTIATMASGVYVSFHGMEGVSNQVPTILSVAFGTVIGFYFSRTNHQAIGGVGNQPEQPYVGR